ncbi:hypothetical protein BDB00DRAFT_824040 [Zychaea mexicana]|uniref:uncharacterized protein n=1 Tax=Zychaea mexicana TaxID=64656 RepID=UPI0022FE2336|nr:uncharacterized protein BDB00DRAFT_824040 [Zychaea mexicana]KAI9493229.1 hypothetical protein BDB00DRAFT_824040 [Zychaea mexicana]
MDDDWRRRDEEQLEVVVGDPNSPYIHEMQPNPYFYQQPMGGYMPISSALPQAYGVPLQPIPMSASSAEGGSVYNGDASDSSQQQQPYGPPAYEANGMVYYGTDPSAAMYPYCYYPPQATMPVPPMMTQQHQQQLQHLQHGGMVVVDDADDDEEEAEKGWGATPEYIYEEWHPANQTTSNAQQSHQHYHHNNQHSLSHQQQQPVNAFYYYPSSSTTYYAS